MVRSFRTKFEGKVLKPLLSFLKQGITPTKLALSISLGLVFGLFPIVGVTTLLCLAISFVFKLNLAAIQLVNYLVYPLQLILLIPLIKLGSVFANVNPIPYSITELLEIANEDFFRAFEMLWFAHLLGIVAWAITILPLGFIVFLILKHVFLRLNKVNHL